MSGRKQRGDVRFWSERCIFCYVSAVKAIYAEERDVFILGVVSLARRQTTGGGAEQGAKDEIPKTHDRGAGAA